jgi:hypothetical protein
MRVTTVACYAVATALATSVFTRSASAQGVADSAALNSARAALQRYEDPYIAIREGYLSTLACMEFDKPGGPGQMAFNPGAMGVHFLNPQAIGPVVGPGRPQVLIYEPVEGKLQLVGAEWFVPLSTGVKERPRLFGHPFDGPMEGHFPIMPHEMLHYDLHVWLFKTNPDGMFAPTNPAVKCTGYPYRATLEVPMMAPEDTTR